MWRTEVFTVLSASGLDLAGSVEQFIPEYRLQLQASSLDGTTIAGIIFGVLAFLFLAGGAVGLCFYHGFQKSARFLDFA